MNVKPFSLLKNFQRTLTYVYLIIMFSFFLFYYDDYFFNITKAKASFFQSFTLCCCFLSLILYIISWLLNPNKKSIKTIFKSLSFVDICLLLWLFSQVITLYITPYPEASFWGSQGRGTGFLFSFLLVSAYFMISKTLPIKNFLFWLLAISSVGIIGLGVFNFFQIDPFHFYEQIAPYDRYRFLSTLGNITFFGDFICFVFPISSCMFIFSKTKKQKIFSYIIQCFHWLGLLICNVDATYIAIFLYLLVLFLVCCKDYFLAMRYFSLLITGIVLAMLLHISILINNNSMIVLQGIAKLLLYFPYLLTTLFFIIIFYIIYRILHHLQKDVIFPKFQKICLVITLFIFVSSITLFVYFSFIDTTTNLFQLENYLRFQSSWATGRGITWMRLTDLYINEFSFLQKLFGYGLDCIRPLLANFIQAQDILYYDNAHNEYLQYLITTGAIGLFLYLCIYFTTLYQLRKCNSIYALFCFTALSTHAIQAIVGLNQPITTPILFLFLAIANRIIYVSKKNYTASLPYTNERKL